MGVQPPQSGGYGTRRAQSGGDGTRWAPTRAAVVGIGLMTVLLAACSGASPTSSPSPIQAPSPTPVPSVTAATPATVVPSAVAIGSGGLSSPARSLPPGVTQWPTDIIDATIALGVLDNQIKLAGSDLAAGVSERDMAQILGASDGLATLLTQALPDAQKLTTWADTKEAGTAYTAVLTAMATAATQAASALREGDTETFVAGMQDLGAALQQYEIVRVPMVDLVDQALLMRHMLVK